MGTQNGKQIREQSTVQIDHIKFENAKVTGQKGELFMQTVMGMEEKDYQKWKQQVSNRKINPENLLFPKKHSFQTKGFCGSTGSLTVVYDYFPYLLTQQIENRKRRKAIFQQCELWFLLYSLSAAQTQMKKLFDCKVGDIRPQNIFIHQQGQIRVSCAYSWPKEQSNFQKTFQHQITLLSPEDMNKLELGGMDDPQNYQSQMFSIGMTVLSAALLSDFSNVYDVKKFKFKFDQAKEYLQQWKFNTVYSEIFTAFISNLCSFEPQKRLTEKELWSWIMRYEEQIKNKDDFMIDHAPPKIDRTVQELRGQSNINMLSEGNGHFGPMIQTQMPIQDRSIVYPFKQGITDTRFNSPQIQNLPANLIHMPMNHNLNNVILSPRQSIPMHHNIQTAQSMYTQIPPESYQRQQFTGYLPPGVQHRVNMPPGQGFQQVPVQQIPVHQQFVQNPNIINGNLQQQNQNGNFVYTRRIIDPNSNSVVAEQRVSEEQYHRGLSDKGLQSTENQY